MTPALTPALTPPLRRLSRPPLTPPLTPPLRRLSGPLAVQWAVGTGHSSAKWPLNGWEDVR